MRIGTWNVEYARGADKNARRRRRLLAADCDVWILTETHDDLSPGPAYTPHATDSRPAREPASRWTTIWTRFPIERVLTVDDPVRTCAVRLATPRGALVVFGTVLPWHSDVGANAAAVLPNWTEFYRVVPAQIREWTAMRRAHADAAMCVAGDLNMNLGGPHHYGTNKGRATLRDGFVQAGIACVTVTEAVPAMALRHGPIDHVCLSVDWASNATVVSAWEGRDEDGVRLSDHSGLAVEC